MFIRNTGSSLNGLFGKLIENREIQRTPAWEPLATVPKPTKQPSINTTADQLQNLGLVQQDEDKFVLPATPQPKPKTRGEADVPEKVLMGEDLLVPMIPKAARTFVLPKKAYKVMTTLFPTDQDREPGKIRWPDFVDAMSKAGFSSQQTAGSSVQFEPSWDDTPISFHRPHPGDEIPFLHLRRHARRLGRRYGWTCESFVSQ